MSFALPIKSANGLESQEKGLVFNPRETIRQMMF
jgi:hypothetical protein